MKGGSRKRHAFAAVLTLHLLYWVAISIEKAKLRALSHRTGQQHKLNCLKRTAQLGLFG